MCSSEAFALGSFFSLSFIWGGGGGGEGWCIPVGTFFTFFFKGMVLIVRRALSYQYYVSKVVGIGRLFCLL